MRVRVGAHGWVRDRDRDREIEAETVEDRTGTVYLVFLRRVCQ